MDYDIERAGGLKSMIFGGEGLFLATCRARVTKFALFTNGRPYPIGLPKTGGDDKGEGSVLGGIGRLLDGDNR